MMETLDENWSVLDRKDKERVIGSLRGKRNTILDELVLVTISTLVEEDLGEKIENAIYDIEKLMKERVEAEREVERTEEVYRQKSEAREATEEFERLQEERLGRIKELVQQGSDLALELSRIEDERWVSDRIGDIRDIASRYVIVGNINDEKIRKLNQSTKGDATTDLGLLRIECNEVINHALRFVDRDLTSDREDRVYRGVRELLFIMFGYEADVNRSTLGLLRNDIDELIEEQENEAVEKVRVVQDERIGGIAEEFNIKVDEQTTVGELIEQINVLSSDKAAIQRKRDRIKAIDQERENLEYELKREQTEMAGKTVSEEQLERAFQARHEAQQRLLRKFATMEQYAQEYERLLLARKLHEELQEKESILKFGR